MTGRVFVQEGVCPGGFLSCPGHSVGRGFVRGGFCPTFVNLDNKHGGLLTGGYYLATSLPNCMASLNC